MDYSEVLKEARTKVGPYCKACEVCNGKACSNKIPGPGALDSDGASINYDAWKKYKILLDPIGDSKDPDISTFFFDKLLSSPILIGPVGAVKSHYSDLYTDYDYNKIIINASNDEKILAFCGDGKDPKVMEDIAKYANESNLEMVPTIKPWDINTIKNKVDLFKRNPIAIAMDIDASGLPFLKNSCAGIKNVSELKEIISYLKSPFIVKGITSVEGARKAYEAGAKGIVISNHGGRVLKEASPTAIVLEEIAKVYKGKMLILVDGGIRSGADIFKALALGADFILIARPFVVAAYGAKEDGVKIYLDKLKNELKDVMRLTSSCTIKDININKIIKI